MPPPALQNTTLRHYNDFLDAVEAYELELEEGRVKAAQAIVTKYLTRPATSDSGVDTCEEPQGGFRFSGFRLWFYFRGI